MLLPPAAPHTYSRNKKFRVEMTSAERSQFTALLKRTALLQTHGPHTPEQKSSGRGGARNKRQTVRQSAGAGLSSACAGRDRRSRARSRARATPSNQPTDQQRAQGGGGRTRVCGERAAPRRLGPPAAEPPLAAPRRYRDTQACTQGCVAMLTVLKTHASTDTPIVGYAPPPPAVSTVGFKPCLRVCHG